MQEKFLRKSGWKSQAGISLVETLVACSILVVGSMGMMGLVMTSIATNNRNKIDSVQTMLVESILEQINSTFNGDGASAITDCAGTTWKIDTTIPNTGSAGANLSGSTIDYSQANPPAGYFMNYVLSTPCSSTGVVNGTYDVRWHLDEVGTTTTYLITVSGMLKNLGNGGKYFALPVTLRFMSGS